MSKITIRINNAARKPLHDDVDVIVKRLMSGQTIHSAVGVDASKPMSVTVGRDEVYAIRCFPVRHRPVGQFVMVTPGQTRPVELFCPIHPDRVSKTQFPAYGKLDKRLTRVLEKSKVEGFPSGGKVLYEALDDLAKAGLLNLFTKMSRSPVVNQTMAWDYVTGLYRIRPDRIFADVKKEFRDAVKAAVAGGTFHKVSGALHTPPPGYRNADSFKSEDRYGNLQLSFFSTETGELKFKVDADIDDAAGLEHAFQVLKNWITAGETHPYDIHEILSFYQFMAPPYELEAANA